MSLRLDRLWLVAGLLPALFVASESHALGLGEITLTSALNEPLDARIELVSATPEELANLRVALASADTFERYGLYRPLFLGRLQFTIVPSGRADGNVIHVTSEQPITEPFVTFLVEASWPRGRLLREYTVLLDPPVFAPPPVSETAPAVTAPSRARPADSGRIERAPVSTPSPESAPDFAFDTAAGDSVRVERGDTLWGISEQVRPDGRVSMNQTMLAIFEANPEAFQDNINRLNAGAVLRVPSADEIFRISRGDATREVRKQNAAFGLPTPRTEPRLTLVPPDEAPLESPMDSQRPGGARAGAPDPDTAARIAELEATIEEQQSLIDVRDEELARLRAELERIRAEAAAAETMAADAATAEPAGETEPGATEAASAEDTGQVFADDGPAAESEPEPEAAAEEPAIEAEAPARTIQSIRRVADEPGLVDRVVDTLTGFWGILGAVLLLVLAILVWLARRAAGRVEEESTGVWDALDAGEDVDSESLASTERLRALARDDDSAIVVVEQEGTGGKATPAAPPADDAGDATGTHPALEDTFSSETAINLDQSDPIAEADFHMAYGLYDQAADLINGALAAEPERQDLMAKLCEIYFVWGNRDSFVDAASRLHDQLGGETSPDWDKIVIMGRQIAADHRLFSGASAAGATRSVDLSLDSDEGAQELDIDFAGGPDGQVDDIVDLAESGESKEQSSIDFLFDDEPDTGASTTREMAARGTTVESPTVESPTIESPAAESTVETPTIEQPSRISAGRDGDATAEIDLDDLGLDLQDLAASGLGDLDDSFGDLDPTTESGVLAANDDDEATGRNLRLDDSSDGATSEIPFLDETTGRNPALSDDDAHSDTDVDLDVDATLLDATGHTQVLRDDEALGDNDRTMLAGSLDDDEDYVATAALSSDDIDTDFDFAKTEALDKSVFDKDTTGEMPGVFADEIDLDLDDLTAALRVSEGDTVDQARDDGTVERPRLKSADIVDLDFGDLLADETDGSDNTATAALSPDDMSDDLHDARTMTEVGTKLDLARAYVDMGDPDGARSILEEVLEEGDDGQRQQARKLIESLPA